MDPETYFDIVKQTKDQAEQISQVLVGENIDNGMITIAVYSPSHANDEESMIYAAQSQGIIFAANTKCGNKGNEWITIESKTLEIYKLLGVPYIEYLGALNSEPNWHNVNLSLIAADKAFDIFHDSLDINPGFYSDYGILPSKIAGPTEMVLNWQKEDGFLRSFMFRACGEDFEKIILDVEISNIAELVTFNMQQRYGAFSQSEVTEMSTALLEGYNWANGESVKPFIKLNSFPKE